MSPSEALIQDLDGSWAVWLAGEQEWGIGGWGKVKCLPPSCRLGQHHPQWEKFYSVLPIPNGLALLSSDPQRDWSDVHSWDLWSTSPWGHLIEDTDTLLGCGCWCCGTILPQA